MICANVCKRYRKSHCLYAGIEQEGKIEGRAEGRDEERFSIARNMKQLGIPVDVIVKSTGLTSGEIETLYNFYKVCDTAL